MDVWFDTYRAPKLQDNGYDLRHNIDRHIRPNIVNKSIEDYTALDITAAINKVSSSRMRQIVYQIYNQSFREAVRAGFIEKNPVEFVEHPKHKYDTGRSLSIAEERIFFEACKQDLLYNLFRFYLLTGCRPSEPLAITWQDVGDKLLHIPGTKTAGASRYLPISEPLRCLIGEIPRGSDRLFPYVYRTVQNHLKSICTAIGLNITTKDLRHTFGTRCIEAGVSMKTVQKWMGHSKYEITVNNKYGHTKNKLRIKAA